MGDVYRAVDTRLGRAVAIKIAQQQFIQRFGREARAISSLNHPHICTLYDVGPDYLVMELVEGETIAAWLKRGPIPTTTALLHASQILAALAEAHDKGIIHRDLKPANIMIAKAGIKVLDFGIAKSDQDETVAASRMVMGTPAYMAPEQREGLPADARADIYSFGCVFYEMLSGTRVGPHRTRVPSRKLERIVSRCLEENPARRWQSVAELERELSAITAATSRRNRDATAVATRPASSQAHRAPKLTDKSTIVLAEFSNATGDPVFDGALRQLLAVQLEMSPHLSLLPDARVSRALSLMGRPTTAKLTPDVAAEICERTASVAVVEGTITSLGSEYGLSVQARHCRTGDVLGQEQARAARKEDVFKALTKMARRFGARVGESLPRVEKAPYFSSEITTSSLEAWRAYNTGLNASMHGASPTEAGSHLKRAVELDPTFAMAHAHLGRHYDSLGASELAAQSIARAYELRDRVSDRENFFITFNYYRQVPRNLELARQTLESWVQKYPGELWPHGFLSGFVSPGTGHHQKAVEEGQQAIELDPDFSIGYYNVGFAYLYLNRISEAEALLRKASERQIEVIQFSLLRYFIAFLRDDKAAMEREVTEPLISALVGSPDIQALRGSSHMGYSFIYVILSNSADRDRARQLVLDRINTIRPLLPADASVTLGPNASSMGWIYQYALVDRQGLHDLRELRQVNESQVKPALQTVPGVAEVASVGGLEKQYQLKIFPPLLAQTGVSLKQVIAAVQDVFQEAGGRMIEVTNRDYQLRGVTNTEDLDKLEFLVLGRRSDG
jgi:tetratricopeptide (TPR) repeat protein